MVPCAIWKNERIAIKQYKLQMKAERWAIHVDDVDKEPIPEMCGRILYLSGDSTVDEKLADSVFTQVTCEGKIKLRRVVEMKQWREKEEKDDDNKHKGWSYEEVWEDEELECKGDRRNPPMPFSSTRRQEGYRAWCESTGDKCAEAEHKNVRLGAYYLGDYVIRELQRWRPLEVSAHQVTPAKQAHNEALKGLPECHDGWWYWGGRSEKSAQIGDVRVKFEVLEPGVTSICAVLTKTDSGYTFVPVLRADSKLEGAAADFGCGCECCLRVKELHYEEDMDEEEFREDLKKRPVEFTRKEENRFERSKTASEMVLLEVRDEEAESGDSESEVKAKGPQKDEKDLPSCASLCCLGCGPVLSEMMHELGLEEEFLGVMEEDMGLDELMEKEGDDAANRHNFCRLASCLSLLVGSLCIISPITSFLTGHWFIAAMGGIVLCCAISCLAVLISTMTSCCIMSVAWLFYRPALAISGITLSLLCAGGVYYVYVVGAQQGEEEQQTAARLLLQLGGAL